MRRILKWVLRGLVLVVLVAGVVAAFNYSKIQRLLRVNSLFTAENIVGNFSDMQGMFFNTEMPVGSDNPTPLPPNPQALPESFTFRGETHRVADWIAERNLTAMVVLKNGQLAHESYYLGTRDTDRRISWSMAKSFLSATFGIAVAEGKIPSLDVPVTDYVPSLKSSAYDGASIRNVLNMASGIRFNEDYLDYNSDINRMGRVLAFGNSMDGFAEGLSERDREPGTRRQYVSIDTHVLGMVLRAATGRSVPDYMAEKLLAPLRLEADAYYLTDGFGTAFVLGGLNMRTRDYARFGLMMALGGSLNGTQIVPADWVVESTTQSAPPPYDGEKDTDTGLLGYGYQWWLPPDAAPGEFLAVGIYGQYTYINSAKGVVIAVNGADRNFRDGDGRVLLANVEMFREIAAHIGNQ
ncbi:MAG: beta-lactamase family protein [Rhodobacteraceae bacterium]|nr:beta-lactamase family protein [Paracoccaceae bacterium]